MYALGHRVLDTYLVIPEAKLKIAQEIVSRLDGTRSLESIAGEYLDRGQRVDVTGLHRSLIEAGLIVGVMRTGELRRLGVHLIDIPVEPLLTRYANFVRRAWLPLICSTGLILLCGAIAASLQGKQIISLALGRIALAPALLYLLAAVAYAGTILWHELFHAIAALRFGLTPHRLSVIGYLAVIPMFAIRIPGLYLVSPAKRICVWVAGIWGSLTLGSAAALALQVAPLALPWRQMLARLALANGIIAAFNLIPFLPTDGYFILSTALRQPNIRLRAWRELKQLLRKSRKTVAAPNQPTHNATNRLCACTPGEEQRVPFLASGCASALFALWRIHRKTNLLLLVYIVLSGACTALLLTRSALRLYWLAHHSIAAFTVVAALICFGLLRTSRKTVAGSGAPFALWRVFVRRGPWTRRADRRE